MSTCIYAQWCDVCAALCKNDIVAGAFSRAGNSGRGGCRRTSSSFFSSSMPSATARSRFRYAASSSVRAFSASRSSRRFLTFSISICANRRVYLFV